MQNGEKGEGHASNIYATRNNAENPTNFHLRVDQRLYFSFKRRICMSGIQLLYNQAD